MAKIKVGDMVEVIASNEELIGISIEPRFSLGGIAHNVIETHERGLINWVELDNGYTYHENHLKKYKNAIV